MGRLGDHTHYTAGFHVQEEFVILGSISTKPCAQHISPLQKQQPLSSIAILHSPLESYASYYRGTKVHSFPPTVTVWMPCVFLWSHSHPPTTHQSQCLISVTEQAQRTSCRLHNLLGVAVPHNSQQYKQSEHQCVQ